MTKMKQDDDMPGTLIFVVQEKLSDGSYVYNIVMGKHKWHATSQKDAQELAEKIMEAIEDHTVDSADVIDETT